MQQEQAACANDLGHERSFLPDLFNGARQGIDSVVEDPLIRGHSKLYQRRREIEAELRRELQIDDEVAKVSPGGERTGRAGPLSFGRPPPVPKPRAARQRLPPIPKIPPEQPNKRRWGSFAEADVQPAPGQVDSEGEDVRWTREEQEPSVQPARKRQQDPSVAAAFAAAEASPRYGAVSSSSSPMSSPGSGLCDASSSASTDVSCEPRESLKSASRSPVRSRKPPAILTPTHVPVPPSDSVTSAGTRERPQSQRRQRAGVEEKSDCDNDASAANSPSADSIDAVGGSGDAAAATAVADVPTASGSAADSPHGDCGDSAASPMDGSTAVAGAAELRRRRKAEKEREAEKQKDAGEAQVTAEANDAAVVANASGDDAEGSNSGEEPEPYWRAKARELEELARLHRERTKEAACQREAEEKARVAAELEATRAAADDKERRVRAQEEVVRVRRQQEEQRLEEIRREELRKRERDVQETQRRRQEQEDWEKEIRQRFAEEAKQRRMASQEELKEAELHQEQRRAELNRQHEQREEHRRQQRAKDERERGKRRTERQTQDERWVREEARYGPAPGAGLHQPPPPQDPRPQPHRPGPPPPQRGGAPGSYARFGHQAGAAPSASSGTARPTSLPPATHRGGGNDRLQEAQAAATQQLRHLKQIPSQEARLKAFKDLLRAWHPDKNPQNVEVATAVFQMLQAERSRAVGS